MNDPIEMILAFINPTLLLIIAPVTVASSFYTLGACVCRLRYGFRHVLRPIWTLMYLAVAVVACLAAVEALHHQAEFFHLATTVSLAAYMHLTAPSWAEGAPPIARVSGSR